MRIVDVLLAELEQEAKTTQKFLEAVAADKLDYKASDKSMTLGKLANHVATIPGFLVDWIKTDEFNMNSGDKMPEQKITKESILAAFEKSLAHAREVLGTLDDTKIHSNWTFKMDGKTMYSMPKTAFVRTWMFNHLYHHRGQLGVYLRLTGAKVPASYGPTPDENPMQMTASAVNA
ncbi:MAG TPA: DinB family protein [Candidatus Xenobia bacterium]|jgi:uncharacterized damage-inducible protein DinB